MNSQSNPRAEIERLLALAEAATPGPWEFDRENGYRESEACNVILAGPDDKPKRLLESSNSEYSCIEYETSEFGPVYFDTGTEADFRFIAEAREAMPKVLRALLACMPAVESVPCTCQSTDDVQCDGCATRAALAEIGGKP